MIATATSSSNDVTDHSAESSPLTINSLKSEVKLTNPTTSTTLSTTLLPNTNVKNNTTVTINKNLIPTKTNMNQQVKLPNCQLDSSRYNIDRKVEQLPISNEPTIIRSFRPLPPHYDHPMNVEEKDDIEFKSEERIKSNNLEFEFVSDLRYPEVPKHDIVVLPTAPSHTICERQIPATVGIVNATEHYEDIETYGVDLASSPRKLKNSKLGRLTSGEVN